MILPDLNGSIKSQNHVIATINQTTIDSPSVSLSLSESDNENDEASFSESFTSITTTLPISDADEINFSFTKTTSALTSDSDTITTIISATKTDDENEEMSLSEKSSEMIEEIENVTFNPTEWEGGKGGKGGKGEGGEENVTSLEYCQESTTTPLRRESNDKCQLIPTLLLPPRINNNDQGDCSNVSDFTTNFTSRQFKIHKEGGKNYISSLSYHECHQVNVNDKGIVHSPTDLTGHAGVGLNHTIKTGNHFSYYDEINSKYTTASFNLHDRDSGSSSSNSNASQLIKGKRHLKQGDQNSSGSSKSSGHGHKCGGGAGAGGGGGQQQRRKQKKTSVDSRHCWSADGFHDPCGGGLANRGNKATTNDLKFLDTRTSDEYGTEWYLYENCFQKELQMELGEIKNSSQEKPEESSSSSKQKGENSCESRQYKGLQSLICILIAFGFLFCLRQWPFQTENIVIEFVAPLGTPH